MTQQAIAPAAKPTPSKEGKLPQLPYVVEIVLPESVGRNRGDKFVEYEAAGVQEYWLIDPEREQAEFYQLDSKTRRYRLAPIDEAGRFHSQILTGFWLRVDWLWQEELPKVLVMAQKLGLLN